MADNLTKFLLFVVAIAVIIIVIFLVSGSIRVQCGPTYGDLISLKDVKDDESRKKMWLRIHKEIPMIRVEGGHIDADVTGNVSID